MSTTRWIIETADPTIPKLTRIVVDPDNLPPERVQQAVRAFLLADEGPFPFLTDDELWREWWEEAGHEHYDDPVKAAVRAFLSDPEPGD